MRSIYQLINDRLIEIEDAKARCLINGNKLDYKLIVTYHELPAREALTILNKDLKRYLRK